MTDTRSKATTGTSINNNNNNNNNNTNEVDDMNHDNKSSTSTGTSGSSSTTTTTNIRYRITGSAAYTRIQPLIEQLSKKYQYEYQYQYQHPTQLLTWIDCSPYKYTSTGRNRNRNSVSGNVNVTSNDDNNYCNDQEDDDNNDIQYQYEEPIDFLWENAPRSEMKYLLGDNNTNTSTCSYKLKCYSHLPNGTNILDSKWVLSRLFSSYDISSLSSSSDDNTRNNNNKYLAILQSHCFVGPDGFDTIINHLQSSTITTTQAGNDTSDGIIQSSSSLLSFRDLDPSYDTPQKIVDTYISTTNPKNWWVIKDSMSNGAGGIWMIDIDNNNNTNANGTSTGIDSNNTGSINTVVLQKVRDQLIDNHNYIIQQYVYPSVLYQQRKCHVRVYCLLTSDGKIYIHDQCFLHVANELFTTTTTTSTNSNTTTTFQDSIHITNCCANSHDSTKFSGEIVASFNFDGVKATTTPSNEQQQEQSIVTVGIQRFRTSIEQSIILLMKQAYPFVQGGHVNNGFEYLGLDFILSYKRYSSSNSNDDDNNITTTTIPVAYLLEVNAPPSQDTATGLYHAEQLHNTVLYDLLTLWVLPNIVPLSSLSSSLIEPACGGWNVVYDYYNTNTDTKTSTSTSTTSTTRTETNAITNVDIPYSKAVLINKIRWMIYENKLKKLSNTFQSKQLLVCKKNQNDSTVNSVNNRTTCSTCTDCQATTITTTVSVKESLINQQMFHFIITHRIRTLFPYFHSDPMMITDATNININTNSTSNFENTIHQDTGCSSVEDCLVTNISTESDIFQNDNQQHKITPFESTATASTTATGATNPIFFENAGGTQVPSCVIRGIQLSLQYRHRNIIGTTSKIKAIRTMYTILGANPIIYTISFNSNASTLLYTLASRYIQCNMIQQYDEIILCIDNHLANVQPWIDAANTVGAIIKWWYPNNERKEEETLLFSSSSSQNFNNVTVNDKNNNNCSFDYKYEETKYTSLRQLVTSKTRIVAIPHVSNVLGIVMDIPAIRNIVRHQQEQLTHQSLSCHQQERYAHIVVDGVSAVPHVYANIDELDIDWYVISLHKMFGPHCGVLCGKLSIASKLLQPQQQQQQQESSQYHQYQDIAERQIQQRPQQQQQQELYQPSQLDIGTVNYEACEGIYGLGCYIQKLSSMYNVMSHKLCNSTMRTGEQYHDPTAITTTTASSSALDNNTRLTYVLENHVQDAYKLIKELEIPLVDALLAGLSRSSKVHILGYDNSVDINACNSMTFKDTDTNRICKELQDQQQCCKQVKNSSLRCNNKFKTNDSSFNRIPVVSFIHETIQSNEIVQYCDTNGIICRCGTFLSTKQLWNEYIQVPVQCSTTTSTGKEMKHGFVRLSLVHYNTVTEIDNTIQILEQLPNWV
jgi:selenocysteine lyase/cysteine desulfurase